MLDFETPQNFTLIPEIPQNFTLIQSLPNHKQRQKENGESLSTFSVSVRRQGLEPWTH